MLSRNRFIVKGVVIMEKKMTFCEECRKDVVYKEKEEVIVSKLKGEEYRYNGKVAICEECNQQLFVSELSDYNLNQLYNEFRRQNDIISLESILEIPEKYNIGKRPLSLLLGWGEQTFSRYCDGDIPTKQYSDILKKISEDPKYYLELLEMNKRNLKSDLAYQKSKDAVHGILGSDGEISTDKIYSVVDYLLSECEDITPLALQKLLYYIQGFCYAFLERFIFEEDCEAWVHGPVFRDIYFKYKEYRFDPIVEGKIKEELNVPTLEKTIIDTVIKNFGCYSGKTLEAFTHNETPWLNTRGDLPESTPSNKIIDKELLLNYFLNVKDKNNMINPSDISSYSKKMFKQIKI